jgi:hypothetical protein
MRISKNFTLDEFTVSQTAERFGIDMHPPELIVDNIKKLVIACLQPLRDEAGPIYISSGYRPLELNTRIGGSKTSAHVKGNAVDFSVTNMTPFDVCELVIAMELPIDQIIHEFGRWTHMGVADVLRGEKLTAYRKDGKVRYTHGIVRMENIS